MFFINENDEFVQVSHYVNDEEEYVQKVVTFQNNGWTRINEIYPDGTTTETFTKEEME